jgi:pimeloyl-ACP methyl ester carboxylesterase
LELHAKEFGQGSPVVILHGLFGFSDNWQTIAKALSENHLVVTPDLRNHGRSPHVSSHTYPEIAEDLNTFLDERWMFSSAVIGHSMGGKAAMQLALTHPDKVERLIVIDMEPGKSDSNHTEIFDAMLSLDTERLASRKDAEVFLGDRIKEPGTVQFLLKNLSREPEGFAWKMNLPVLLHHYQDVLAPITGIPFEKPTLFIRGGNSDYIRDEEWPSVLELFPNARLATIEGAGHWVHVDKPLELLELIRAFLNEHE